MPERDLVIFAPNGENGEEDIFEGWDLKVVTHQLIGPHEGVTPYLITWLFYWV